jgi:hypothetical protein
LDIHGWISNLSLSPPNKREAGFEDISKKKTKIMTRMPSINLVTTCIINGLQTASVFINVFLA